MEGAGGYMGIELWLVLLIVFLIIEVATLGLTTIWFAGGALVAIIAAILHVPVAVQIILFFLVSLVLLFFTRPVAVKYFNKDRIKTNVESLVGKRGIVTEEVDNIHAKGQVTVNGQEWSARSLVENETIPQGAVVTVMAISGVKLIVREAEVSPSEAGAERFAVPGCEKAPDPVPECTETDPGSK